jgi:hypothetical protein
VPLFELRNREKERVRMKAHVITAAVAIFLFAPSPCFALWDIETVSRQRAKELGMEVRWKADGPNQVRVDLQFKAQGELKGFSRVELRSGEGNNLPGAAPQLEERSKPGRVAVRFTASRAQLSKLTLRVLVPGGQGGTVYELRMKDFVRPGNGS